jgi:hypothetical protein
VNDSELGTEPMKRRETDAAVLLMALALGGCTSFPDPANRAVVDAAVVGGIGALIGGVVTSGGIGLPIGFGAGAAIGAIAGAGTPPAPITARPAFPW